MSATGPFVDLPPGSLRILQVTDTHLYGDPGGRLLGLNTLSSLDQVLALARWSLGEIDLILATGDLVHDASPRGYARLQERLAAFGIPVYCIPGNHDLSARMAQHLAGNGVHLVPSTVHGDWLLVFLDSTIPEEDGGHLSAEELERLETTLDSHPDKHALICLHHHPLPTGSAWMDEMAVDNAEELLTLVQSHPRARGILWGHIHQHFERCVNGSWFLGSPSTCIQFTPGAPDFGLSYEPPGYRWLALLPNGEIRTGLHRLAALPEGLDMNSGGY
jgi:Icc protein